MHRASDVADFVGLEVMKTAKGRDKLAAFVQNFAKWYSLEDEIGSRHHEIWRNTENNISDGRKIFKWMKFFPEWRKSRRAFRRAWEQRGKGETFPMYRSLSEGLGRGVSCVYYIYENVIWAAARGLLHSTKLPGHLRHVSKVPAAPEDGPIVRTLGGSAVLKDRKNFLSMYKLYTLVVGECLFWMQYVAEGRRAKRTEVVAHLCVRR